MSTLLLVESPVKAQTIQKYLGDDYVVIATYGHIADLISGGNHGIGVDIDKNFRPHYSLMPDKVNLFETIINTARASDLILLGTDGDREGEAISWHLQSRLEDLGKPIKRIVFSEIKKSALSKAIKEARDVDINLFHAQEARRILDRIVGFMASPFLMNSFGSKLSAGRVQSVVTRMVIDREKEIDSFIPEDFWTIQASLKNELGESFIAKYPNKLSDQKTSEFIFNKMLNSNFFVSKVERSDEKKSPPPPLITSALQQLMSKAHSMSADRTMKAAQALYECGHCTYIRSDSVRVGEEAIEAARDYLSSNSLDIPQKPNVHKNKNEAQDAHEAIRPSDISLIPGQNYSIIDPDEKLVYEMIWRYFLASQMPAAIYSTLKVFMRHESDKDIELRASGKALKYKGFLEILGIHDTSKIDIPNLKKGDILSLLAPPKLEKKQTQPPARFSEQKLLKELEDRAIGRPATYAELLSKICSRNYVEKHGNVFHPTDLGTKITNMLKDHFTFMDYNYTKDIEAQLDFVEQGKMDHVQMLKNFYPSFKSELDKAYISNGATLCEKCNSPMLLRTVKSTGVKFLGCSGFPHCKSIKEVK